MAHYAFVDENNIVVEVITGRDENDLPRASCRGKRTTAKFVE
jgi:hypothetical protein